MTYTKPTVKKTYDAMELARGVTIDYIRNTMRNQNCTSCELHLNAENVCLMGNGLAPSKGMIVSESPSKEEDRVNRPLLGSTMEYLANALSGHDLFLENFYITHAVKCLPPREDKEKALEKAIKACAPYLDQEIATVKPKAILAMGGTAYYYFAHKKGILKSRGQAFFHEKSQAWVVPTVHPFYVLSNPAYDAAFQSDVGMWKRYMSGETKDPEIDVQYINSLSEWEEAEKDLRSGTGLMTFDLETRGFKDFDQPGVGYSQVWCAALTRGRKSEKGIVVYLLPLEHPDSPFLANPLQDWENNWSSAPLGLRIDEGYHPIVHGLLKLVEDLPVSGHNVKFDVRQLGQLRRRYARSI